MPAATLSFKCPNVRHLSRGKDGVTWTQLEPFVANLQEILTFNGVEPLFLIMVEVTWGARVPFYFILNPFQ